MSEPIPGSEGSVGRGCDRVPSRVERPGDSARRLTLAVALLATTLLAAACGPVGPFPGGELGGDPTPAPSDWGFMTDVDQVQIETRPDEPYSVNTWIYGSGDRLYVPTSLILGASDPTERQWVRNVVEDDRVRLRVEGRVYELRARRVTDPVELEKARAKLLEKYEVEDDEHAQAAWIFRLEPR